MVAFRAFRPLDAAMTKTLLKLLAKPQGRLAAWKAREAKIREEMGGIETLVGRITSYNVCYTKLLRSLRR